MAGLGGTKVDLVFPNSCEHSLTLPGKYLLYTINFVQASGMMKLFPCCLLALWTLQVGMKETASSRMSFFL